MTIVVGEFPGYLMAQTPLLKGEGHEVVRAPISSIPYLWLLANRFHFLFEHPASALLNTTVRFTALGEVVPSFQGHLLSEFPFEGLITIFLGGGPGYRMNGTCS